ncbi:MAG: transglutaminase family protein [Pseudomonadota bacterium]
MEALIEIAVDTYLRYATQTRSDLLLQVEATSDADQTCLTSKIAVQGDPRTRALPGDDGVGQRRWIRADDMLDCHYAAHIRVHRAATVIGTLRASSFTDLPADVVPYLMPSRFCHSEQFDDFVRGQFGEHASGAMIGSMTDWIYSNFRYDPAASPPGATATESFHALAGVCRDYAHMLITLSRAAGVPARFVSAYGHTVRPQDFHAVAEVWLDDAWRLVDATGMTQASEIVRIGVGRDAADVSFLTSYGPLTLLEQNVSVQLLDC